MPIFEHIAALLNISVLIWSLFFLQLLFSLREYHRWGKASKNFLAFQLPYFKKYIRANVQISASCQKITFVFLAYLQSIFSSRISTIDCHIGGRTGIFNLKKKFSVLSVFWDREKWPRTGPNWFHYPHTCKYKKGVFWLKLIRKSLFPKIFLIQGRT